MMQGKSFFSFSREPLENPDLIISKINLNPDHEIFKGHFPGNPILPGACMVQMVKLILADFLHKKILLYKAENIKFLSFIHPTENDILIMNINFKIDAQSVQVKAQLEKARLEKDQLERDSTILFKFNGSYKIKSL